MHITCRIAAGLPSLRDPKTVALLFNYLARICQKEGFRIVEFSIQGNHIHLLCEVDSQEALSSAMNGIQSGMARVLNRHWKRRGKVFADRYHSETIRTPTQCRHVLIYVLSNARKHGWRPLDSGLDPCSTAPWFFSTPMSPHLPRSQPQSPQSLSRYPLSPQSPSRHPLSYHSKPAATPQSWLLREGWKKIGPISPYDHPHIPKNNPSPRREAAHPS